MKYLLDTCVISELIKKNPNKKVVEWLSETPENDMFICVFTIGEIQKGIAKLKEAKKKNKLLSWVNNELRLRFKNKILPFDIQTSITWGNIQANSELAGRTLPIIDGLIAAVGISNDLIVVTRNTKDMNVSGVELFNPWVE